MPPNAKIKAMWARYVQAKEEKMANETEYAELIKWLEMLQIPVGYSGDLSTASRSREPLRAANAIRTLLAREERLSQLVTDHEEVAQDKRRLARELDVALNGEKNAARQASLCDLIPDAERLAAENARLKEALKPFAESMEHLDIQMSDEPIVVRIGSFPLTYGNFRRARAALGGEPS
jgi:hypothetical protein